jgi:hypothetical protein
VRCGEFLVEPQIAQQTLHLSYVGLPAQGVLTELAHLRCRGHLLARAGGLIHGRHAWANRWWVVFPACDVARHRVRDQVAR